MPPGTPLAGFKKQFRFHQSLGSRCVLTQWLFYQIQRENQVWKSLSPALSCAGQTSIPWRVHLRGCVGWEMENCTVEPGQVKTRAHFQAESPGHTP